MKEYDILDGGGVKTYSDPSNIFHVVQTPLIPQNLRPLHVT